MKIHHIRNATMVIEVNDIVLLIDPMLGKKGSMSTLTFFRFKPQRNPIVELPETTDNLLKKVTHCLITHKHPDHIDKAGIEFLSKNDIPVICSKLDENYFKDKCLNISQSISYWKNSEFLGGKITGIPARHGYGFVAKPMGNVMGYFIEFEGLPSVYLSSDTIYTNHVDKVLKEYKPDISVVACGSAQLDIFKPLLMNMDDILTFCKNAPGKVIANHLEAVNHCPTTRTQLKQRLNEEGLSEKVFVADDGAMIDF